MLNECSKLVGAILRLKCLATAVYAFLLLLAYTCWGIRSIASTGNWSLPPDSLSLVDVYSYVLVSLLLASILPFVGIRNRTSLYLYLPFVVLILSYGLKYFGPHLMFLSLVRQILASISVVVILIRWFLFAFNLSKGNPIALLLTGITLMLLNALYLLPTGLAAVLACAESDRLFRARKSILLVNASDFAGLALLLSISTFFISTVGVWCLRSVLMWVLIGPT